MNHPNRRYKDAIYEQLARIGKAIASPARMELLDILCQGPRTVETLAGQTNLSVANTSHHLQVLRQARLVQAEKDGVFVTYSPADQDVCAFYRALCALATARIAEIDHITRQFLTERDALEAVTSRELLSRIRLGEVTVLDVRPHDEYRAGHLPGALSVPLEELEARLDELPKNHTIVAYCRGPYCVLAVDAVTLLKRRGFTAVRLQDGVPEWRGQGLEVES